MTNARKASPELIVRVRDLEASNDFRGVVRLLEALPRPDLLRQPELGYHLAYGWRRVGRAADALELAEALDLPVRRRAVPGLERRRLNLEAMLRFEAGDVEWALSLWQQLVEKASADGDHVLLAAAHNNLGVIHTLMGQYSQAIATYARALMAYQRLGDRRGLAQAHQNLGITCREAGLTAESEAHFRDAIAHARSTGSEDVLGRAEEERSLLYMAEGDTQMAEITARRALKRLEREGDLAGVGEALRVMGIVALRERRTADASERLEGALARARETNHVLLEADTLEATAVRAASAG
ncbi:MAG: tetratricopeptide repeat protein, partial [Gemmatimonadota bacterium]